ncbi:hypothetical protein VDG1235_3904 [Verrucomicrobiia bacterium DG1235]|nr:hypothetical protein VDG1235_2209 [Verrucomicrobiae bacterium DG1235]EDY84273.1 hypothetical protein VDG1235_3904 [Verrucomicrobiae bacterium DG1235]
MKTFLRILTIVVVVPVVGMIVAIVASTVLSNSKIADENSELKSRITMLEKQLGELKNQPDLLLSKAIDLRNTNRPSEAKDTLFELQEKYSNFKSDEINKLISELDYEIIVQKELEAEEQKRKDEEESRLAEEKAKHLEQQRIEEERLANERKIALAAATKNLKSSVDEIKEIEFFKDRSSPDTNAVKNIHAYIGKKGNQVWLRFKMSYNSDDWLFVESATFKVDGELVTLKYNFFDDWERDNGYGGIWEWKDVSVDREIWNLINQISDSDDTMMRYGGRQYHHDRKVSSREKAALKNVILAYEAMGGVPPEK